jgi:hypothetical protein
VRNYRLALPALVLVGGCGIEAYARDPTNQIVLAVFLGILGLLFLVTLAFGRPETSARKTVAVRQERNWLRELEETRNNFVVAQQAIIDHALELMSEEQREDAELRRLRLKSHSAMSKIIQLQEEMLRAGVASDKVNAWEEV